MHASTPERNPSTASTDDARFVGRLLLVALVGAGIAALWLLRDLLLLVFAAILVAVILHTIADPISARLRIGRRWSLALAVILVTGVLALVIYLFGYQIATQVQGLIMRLPQAVTRLRDILQLDAWSQLLKGGDSASAVTDMISRALSWSFTLAGSIASLAIVTFGGIYLALEPRLYRDGFLKLVPPAHQATAAATLDDCAVALRRWLGAQLVAMIAVGALIAIGLGLIGMPSALALGLISGIAEFIPYIGPIAAAVPGLMIAGSLDWQTLTWALAIYVVVQQIESNLLVPVLASRSVAIPPALAAFAVVAMGILFGPLGLLLGFPLSVVLDVAVRRLYVLKMLGEPVEISGQPTEPSDP